MEYYIVYVIVTVYLCWLSFLDLKYKEVDNWRLSALGLIGFVFVGINDNLAAWGVLTILVGIVGYYLWSKGVFGGADLKLLLAIVPWLPFSGIPNGLAMLVFFLIWFAIVSAIYCIIWRLVLPKDRIIPFIPVITIVYTICWVFRFS